MDECKDSIWASYNCPKERDDDADIYCKTAGLGVASIVVLGVTVVMIMIMCMMCCLHQRNKGSASKMFYSDEEVGASSYGSTRYAPVSNGGGNGGTAGKETAASKRQARLAALTGEDTSEPTPVQQAPTAVEDRRAAKAATFTSSSSLGRAEARRQSRMTGAQQQGVEEPTPKQSAEAHREARRQARLALTAGTPSEARRQRVAALTGGDDGSLADELRLGKKKGGDGLLVPPPMVQQSRRNRNVSYSSDNSL